MPVLSGDIGGTKTLLQLSAVEPGRCQVLAEQRYSSQAYDGLAPMVRDFLRDYGAGHGVPSAACFGVAGPVLDTPGGQQAKLTNLPWQLDSEQLASGIGIAKLRLINDFRAIGYGLELLAAEDLAVLQQGKSEARAVRALVGAGTGLGVGMVVWQGDRYEPLPSEGGHVDFAPTDDQQAALRVHLAQQFGTVSYERLLSGPGLVNIYRYLRLGHGAAADVSAEGSDAAARISAAAENDPVARAAVELFVSVYGAFAGNLALTTLARGGVYIAGGIAPKMIQHLRGERFLAAFRNKGRMRVLLEAMPVQVVMNPKVGLLGTALAASRL